MIYILLNKTKKGGPSGPPLMLKLFYLIVFHEHVSKSNKI